MKKLLVCLFMMSSFQAFGSGVSWTSIKTCYGGYEVQKMTAWANENYVTKYVMSLRRESAVALAEQLVGAHLSPAQFNEIQQFVVTTPSYGVFEGELSFGKVIAREYSNGQKVELKVYDLDNHEMANYYYNVCY
jgi:hypothetical protein